MSEARNKKYNNLEQEIDRLLSSDRIFLLPPGFWMFILVNILLIVGVAMLVLIMQDIMFTGEREKAAVFSVISGIILSFIIVTPTFFVLRGFRNALSYLKTLDLILLVTILLFSIFQIIRETQISWFTYIGIIAFVSVLFLISSYSYQLLSLFTARRRGLAKKIY